MSRSAIRPLFAFAHPSTSIVRSRLATEAKFDPLTVERATDDVDVCIVGGGPAGLSAAIRLKQLDKERGGEELRVVVLEKGAEVGQSPVT
jgi:electron-transferring-flavoprotein dehydrogenase